MRYARGKVELGPIEVLYLRKTSEFNCCPCHWSIQFVLWRCARHQSKLRPLLVSNATDSTDYSIMVTYAASFIYYSRNTLHHTNR